MMRKFPARLALVDERRLQKNMSDHQTKIRKATCAIDCIPPATYAHLLVKPKKLQIEKERIWRIEDENRRLLSRLNEIMNRDRRKPIRSNNMESKRQFTSQLPMVIGHSAAGTTLAAASTMTATVTSAPESANGRPERDTPPRMKPRPHSVAVMRADRSTVHSASSKERLMSKEHRIDKRSVNPAGPNLCGCPNRGVHRHPNKPHLEKQSANVDESNVSPLFDVNPLQRGIQSVEITLKQN